MAVDLSMLDESQTKAVLDTEGSVLIYAGAGAGKTRVISMRVAYLIDQGIPPENILCFTFTNKAATEMKERIEAYTGLDSDSMWIGTFHSICSQLLRKYGSKYGIHPDFTVYDEEDARLLLTAVCRDLGVSSRDYKTSELSEEISALKRSRRTLPAFCEELGKRKHSLWPKTFTDVFRAYQVGLRSRNVMDFDDLLMRSVLMFRNDPAMCEQVSRGFQYVQVDEYQDTAGIESELVQKLSHVHGNLCVVGDARQAIYGWRGSDHKIIIDFPKNNKDTKVHILGVNYRSCKRIVAAGEALIANSAECPKYTCTSNKDEKGHIQCKKYNSDIDEADEIAHTIHELSIREGLAYSSVGVLCRKKALTHQIEQSLLAYGIPYTKTAGTEFYSRKEVKCAVCYLRLVQNRQDDGAALYALDKLGRGVGSGTLDKLRKSAQAEGKALIDVLGSSERPKGVTSPAWTSLQKFHWDLTRLMTRLKFGATIVDLVDEILDQSPLKAWCLEQPNANDRWMNLEDLRTLAARVEGEAKDSLQGFLENISLVDSSDEVDQRSGKVQIMTIHQAKGLEFPVVFIPGLEEGILPSGYAMNSEKEMEEERRLFYVAITRAIDKLYVSYCDRRMLFGKTQYAAPSRLLSEVTAWQLH